MTSGSGFPDFEPPWAEGGQQPEQPTPDERPPDQLFGQPAGPSFEQPLDNAFVQPGHTFGQPPSHQHQQSPQPPTKTSRRGLIIFAAVIVVLAMLVAADRISPRFAGDRMADTLQTELGTDQPPDVRFGGFPFLNQIITRHFQRVSITARGVPADDGKLTIKELDATLKDVRPDQGYRKIAVGRLTGSATVDYPSVSDAAGTPVSYAPGGSGLIKLQLAGSVDVTGSPAIDEQNQQLYLDDPRIQIGGQVLTSIPPDLAGQLLRVPIPELLPGVELDDVSATPQGLIFDVTGQQLTFKR